MRKDRTQKHLKQSRPDASKWYVSPAPSCIYWYT